MKWYNIYQFPQKALLIFHDMESTLNFKTQAEVVKSYLLLNDFETAKSHFISSLNFGNNEIPLSSLVGKGGLDFAYFAVMINGFLERKLVSEAYDIFNIMLGLGVKSNALIYLNLMNAMYKSDLFNVRNRLYNDDSIKEEEDGFEIPPGTSNLSTTLQNLIS